MCITNGKKALADDTKWVEGILKKYGVAANHIAHGVQIVRQMVHADSIAVHVPNP